MTAAPRAADSVIPASERLIIFLVGAIQFVNIVDFMVLIHTRNPVHRRWGGSFTHGSTAEPSGRFVHISIRSLATVTRM